MPPRSACEGCGAWRVDAELANEAVAEAAPLAPGAKVTVKDTGWLGATVTGNERPLTENLRALVPTKLTENADTLAPVASVCLPPVLTKTLPTLPELTFNMLLLAVNLRWSRGRRWTRD